jgi:hypothetical protein
MVYVVEIENDGGGRATKEYEASSPYELNYVISHDLREYPRFRVVDAWPKANPHRQVFISAP